MTADRHAAYCRAKEQMDKLGTGKFHEHERDVLDGACDDLLLTSDPFGPEAADAKQVATTLLEQMIDAGRLLPETAEVIRQEIIGCAEAQSVTVS